VPDLAERTQSGPAIRALLSGAIDYAGLFPPASLSMHDAVRNYAEYSTGVDAWALGRFVVPIARLAEFADSARSIGERPGTPWRLSALAGAGGAGEWRAIDPPRIRNSIVDTVELRANTAGEVAAAAVELPKDVDVFYEIPIADDPAELIAAIARTGAKAKVRTGGVTAEAFPPARNLARFIVACVQAGVPFKATAGLHHPLRATYRLTYDSDSPRGEMFGFVNVLLAAAFASNALSVDEVEALLVERDVAAMRFDAEGVSWRQQRVAVRQLAAARGAVALSFGSCSFTEPIAELKELGLL
jgi:hypothetical protein